MAVRLDLSNFFKDFFILKHDDSKLDTEDHSAALIYSIVLGVFTLGVVHGICYLVKIIQSRDIKPVQQTETSKKRKR